MWDNHKVLEVAYLLGLRALRVLRIGKINSSNEF